MRIVWQTKDLSLTTSLQTGMRNTQFNYNIFCYTNSFLNIILAFQDYDPLCELNSVEP